MSTDQIGRELERLAVERRLVFLAEQIKALPGDEFFKSQVLSLIDEATVVGAPGNGLADSLAAGSQTLPGAPTAAASDQQRARAPRRYGSGSRVRLG